MFQQQVEEDARRFRVVAQAVVDQVKVGGDQAHGVGVKQVAGAQRLFKDAQQVYRVGEERGRVGHVDAALDQLVAGDDLGAAEQAAQPGFGLDMPRFKPGQEDAGQIADAGGVAEEILHEHLDSPPPAGVAVAHSRRNFGLHVEGQLVHRAARDVMQVAAHRPQEGLGAFEGIELVAGEQVLGDEPLRSFDAVEVFADPVQRLQIAQAALGFLDIGFQDIALLAMLFVPLAAFGQLGFDELGAGRAEQVRPKPLVQLCCESGIARDEAMFQERGANGEIRAAELDAVFHGPAGMADFQFQVPQKIEDAFDQAFGPGRDLGGQEEQQVHVGMGGHLGPAIAADRDHGQPVGGGARMQPDMCDMQRQTDEVIRQP